MFKSLRQLIDTRLQRPIVLEDFYGELGHFLRIHPDDLLTVTFFLKNDPDTRLLLLDYLFVLENNIIHWPTRKPEESLGKNLQIFYQLSSIKLPYQINIGADVPNSKILPSLSPIFLGAAWLESDLAKKHGITFTTTAKK